jgi:hypothetical protein
MLSKRLNLELNPLYAGLFDRLMVHLGFTKYSEAMQFMITISTWCVEQRQGGRKILSVDPETKEVTEMFFPMLNLAKPDSDAAIQRIGAALVAGASVGESLQTTITN